VIPKTTTAQTNSAKRKKKERNREIIILIIGKLYELLEVRLSYVIVLGGDEGG
jgi:hypothetical protein